MSNIQQYKFNNKRLKKELNGFKLANEKLALSLNKARSEVDKLKNELKIANLKKRRWYHFF